MRGIDEWLTERTNRRRSASEKELVAAAMEEQPEPLLCATAAWTGSSASRAGPPGRRLDSRTLPSCNARVFDL